MRRVALALAMLLAGCVEPPVLPETTSDEHDLVNGFEWRYDADCVEVDLVLFVDKAKLAPHLPDGFRPADASAALGAPPQLATGRGAVLATAIECDAWDRGEGGAQEGQILVLVEPPRVAGERAPAALDYYEVLRYTSAADEARVLDAIGWPRFDGEAQATWDAPRGAGVVSENGTAAHSLVLTAPTSSGVSGVARSWHDTPHGLAHWDRRLDDAQRHAGPASCTIAPGSPLSAIAGMTTCAPNSSQGWAFPRFETNATLRLLPGVRARV